jgi:hypothetical protein
LFDRASLVTMVKKKNQLDPTITVSSPVTRLPTSHLVGTTYHKLYYTAYAPKMGKIVARNMSS